MRFLIVIPARAGSKSIKNKCLFKINKKPLIEYTFANAFKLKKIKSFVVSDSKKIKKIAKKYNINTEYVRPKKLSKDDTPIADTLFDFVKWTIKKKIFFDYLILLQPTSPLRSLDDIKKSINIIKRFKYESLSSISRSLEHPYETIKFSKQKWCYVLPKGQKYFRRQDFDFESYFINGAIFVVNKKLIYKKKMQSKSKHGFYLMPKIRSLDINDKEEIDILKKIIK